MQIGIFANGLRDVGFKVADKLVSVLESKGIEVKIHKQTEENYIFPDNAARTLKGCDVIMILGGDGTVLSVAGFASDNNIPLLGVNTGHTGFLTEVEADGLEEAAAHLASGDYSVEERSTVRVDIGGKSYFALNDVVLSKGANTRPVDIKVDVDSQLLDRYFADGIIISTPTGSTAYSLSAGGPVLSPDIEGLIIIPICAHSLHSRPLVVSDKHTLYVSTEPHPKNTAVIVDGKTVCELSYKTEFFVKKSQKTVKFIKINGKSFYSKLLHKMNYWGVTDIDSNDKE